MQNIQCPQCQASFKWKPELAGKRVKCRCGQSFIAAAQEEIELAPIGNTSVLDEVLMSSAAKSAKTIGPSIPREPTSNAYVHDQCGTITELSQDIIDTLRIDPWYFGRGIHCMKCGSVPDKNCTFVDTGERLDEYRQRYRAQKGAAYHAMRLAAIPVGGLIGTAIGWIFFPDVPGSWLGGLFGGLVAGYGLGREIRLRLAIWKVL